MSFTIDSIYQRSTPRGDPFYSDRVDWNTATPTPAVVSSQTSMTIFINKIIFRNNAFSLSTGALMDLVYPDSIGTTSITKTFTDLDELRGYGTGKTVDGVDFISLIIDPPIKVIDGTGVPELAINTGSGFSYSTGTLSIQFSGWKISTSSY